MGFERKPIALSRARTQTLGTAILFQSKNFWLSPHSLSESGGYQPREIRKLILDCSRVMACLTGEEQRIY